jgi:uncharacterized protein (DUF1330 family)
MTDSAKFEEYRQRVAPLVKKFSGRYLVRGGELRRLESSARSLGNFGVSDHRGSSAIL